MHLLSFCLNFTFLNYVLKALLRCFAYFSSCECDKTKADYLHETNENFTISETVLFFPVIQPMAGKCILCQLLIKAICLTSVPTYRQYEP